MPKLLSQMEGSYSSAEIARVSLQINLSGIASRCISHLFLYVMLLRMGVLPCLTQPYCYFLQELVAMGCNF